MAKKDRKYQVRVVIPSMGRATTMTTHKLLKECEVCVPEAEHDAYAAVVGEENVIVHSNDLIGLPKKRNWILSQTTGDDLMMVDDDLIHFVRRYETDAQKVRNPEVVNAVIDQVAMLSRELGAVLFGFATTGDHRYYDPFSPIELTGFVNGTSIGLLAGHNLRFSESITAKNDYYVSAMNAYMNRICCKDSRFGFVGDETFSGLGGMARFRNSATEERDVAYLQQCFGEACKVVKQAGFGGQQVHVGYQKVSLQLPY